MAIPKAQPSNPPLARYGDLIRGTLNPLAAAGPFSAEDAYSLQVERGAAYAAALVDPRLPSITLANDRLLELARTPEALPSLAIIDRAGHRRPLYRPLLVYALLRTTALTRQSPAHNSATFDGSALRPWCAVLESTLTASELAHDDSRVIPASRGPRAAALAWSAAALHAAGQIFDHAPWHHLAADFFSRLSARQQPGGPFLLATARDNPETGWYHELVLLHAAASYAVQSNSPTVSDAVRRNALYLLNEVEPNHATEHPWGLFAFLQHPETQIVADALLHAARARPESAHDGLSQTLLADTLHNLQLLPSV